MAESFFSKHLNCYKNSFLDYFNSEDRDNVLQILDKYRVVNHQYYQDLIKKYGKNYAQLNKNRILTKEEEDNIVKLKNNIKMELKQLKNGKTKEYICIDKKKIFPHFLDYFEELDKNYAVKIIETYRLFANDYYKTLIRLYSEDYNTYQYNAKCSDKEIKTIKKFARIIQSKIKQIHSGYSLYDVLPKEARKIIVPTDYLDNFNYEYRNLALKIIEEHQKQNSLFFQILIKKYGENYDDLNYDVQLTKQEEMYLKMLTSDIEDRIKEIRKSNKIGCIIENGNNFYDFFEESDYDSLNKILDIYKKINYMPYKIAVKKYGDDLLKIHCENELTKEETTKLRTFIITIKKQLKEIKSGKKLEETMPYNDHHYYKSFLSFFKEYDRKKAIKILNDFQITHPEYYQLVVKKYGPNYDTINLEVKLTEEEKKLFLLIRKTIQKKLKEIASNQTEIYHFSESMSALYRKYPKLKQETNKNLVVLTCFIDKNMSVDKISSLTRLPIQTIDSILISHLYLFETNAMKMIDSILERGSLTANQIVNIISLRGEIQYLSSLKSEIQRLKVDEEKQIILS